MLHDFAQGLPEGFEEIYPIRRGSTVAAVDWNKPTRPIDLDVWSKQTSNFWLPEKIPLSNDLKSWNLLDEGTQRVVTHSLASLTRLDTLQAEFGAPCLLSSPGITPHESANLSFITGMEAVHARSYSSIFSTLLPSDKIDEAFKLANADGLLSSEMDYFLTAYQGSQINPLADSLPGSTLTALKAALPYDNIFQCHRSFLVNVNNICSAKGNSNGYQLRLSGCDDTVPVSRTFVPGLRRFVG